VSKVSLIQSCSILNTQMYKIDSNYGKELQKRISNSGQSTNGCSSSSAEFSFGGDGSNSRKWNTLTKINVLIYEVTLLTKTNKMHK
jgi:hypothetical protein